MSKIAILVAMLAFLASCVVVHEKTVVPPGQIKKQTAPGQMKKY